MPIAVMSMHSLVGLVGSENLSTFATIVVATWSWIVTYYQVQQWFYENIGWYTYGITVCLINWIFFCNGSNLMDFNGSMFRKCGAGAAGAGTFCPEPEPSRRFTWSRSQNRSQNAFPEPEPSKIFTAPHLWLWVLFSARHACSKRVVTSYV